MNINLPLFAYSAQLPNEAELAGVSQGHGLLYYFEWLTNRPNIDIDLTYLEHLINKGADVSAQQGRA